MTDMMDLKTDKDVELMYTAPHTSRITRANLSVRLSRQFDRKLLPPEYERSIDACWEDRLRKNLKLWNGTKFRLDSVTTDEHSGTTFNLGITSYKDFIGTNWSPDAGTYRRLGQQTAGDTQQFMSDALGVGALVQTSDDCFVLLRRSAHCGEAGGLWDIPGGHPEPKVIVGAVDAGSIDVSGMAAGAVVREIFDSTLLEVVEEVNIRQGALSDPVLMGVARNTTSAGRPSSEYYIRCSLDSAEILRLYNSGSQREADESTAIRFVPMSKVMTLQDERELWDSMAPSAKGCVTLYQTLVAQTDGNWPPAQHTSTAGP